MAKKPKHDEHGYYKAKAGEWVQLSRLPFSNYDSCCGCGLVHRFEFKLVKASRSNHITIWRRMFIDDATTNRIRKQRVKKKEMFTTDDGWYIAAFPVNARKRKQKKRK